MAPGAKHESQEVRAVEGSLDATGAAIEAMGQRALPVPMDLLDRPTIDAMVDTVYGTWRRIDALVNNAIYQGAGRMDRVLDLDLDAAMKLVMGNYVNQLHLIQLVVPRMLDAGGGRVVNMASATASMDPPAPAGEGGWGLGYGASKAAFLRVAGQLDVEFAPKGIVAFNVDPGFTTNDKPSDEVFAKKFRGAPPEVTGAAIAWLCSSDDALELAGTLVYSQPLCKRRQLLPGWPPA
jgi:NAD(P)-dependent dehydrogenase (short-subunit alcohol dehydrogenase family)